MNEKQSICQSCGCVGTPIKLTKGSFSTELALWYLCILPGFIYAIWRYFTRYDACPRCKQPSMVPVDTPRGQELLGAHEHENQRNQRAPVSPEEDVQH